MLIGRKSERAALHALVDGARHGRGGALLLTGDPGIGKTVLLRDAMERARGLTILRAAGLETSTELPFVDLAELLRPAERAIGRLPAPQAEALRQALALEEAQSAVDPLAVGVAALGLLATLARRRPVVVVVDDLQWVDAPSRGTIAFVARRLARLHIALLCAARAGELPEGLDLPVLELGALRPKEAGELLATASRRALARDVRRSLLEVSEGNPLALVELPTALTDAQLAGEEPLGEPVPVNGGIERTFGARVARLPERTRRALLIAAAAGSDAGESLTDALRGAGLDEGDLQPAVLDRLVALADGNVLFRHPLVRSVVYSAETEERRQEAHALLASVEPDEDRRVWHLAAATAAPDEDVATGLAGAADRALARGAPASAVRAYDEAARFSADDASRGRLRAAAARAAHRAGDVASAARHVAAAKEHTSDPVTLADLLLVESDLRMRDGDLEGAHRALTEQAERLVRIDPRRAATMLLLASKLRVYRLEATAAADEVERALEILPADERSLLHQAALSMSRTVAGREGARESALAAAELAASSPHGHAHTLAIAWPLIWLEEYELAREVTDRAIEVQRESGFLLYLPQALLPRSELDFRTGRWDPAVQHGTEALALFEETKQPSEAAWAAAVLARMHAARGNAEECRALAQRALASDVEFGLRSSSVHALAALGLLALGSRRPEEAVAHLEVCERITASGGVGEPWLLLATPDFVEALTRAGQQARAVEVLAAFHTRAEEHGRVSALAAAARCAGLLAVGNGWRDEFERALELHARVPTPFQRARTELCYAERLRRTRKRSQARGLLRSALAAFDELGAAPWSERVRAELRASGQTARRRSTPFDALTEQELAVARLVVSGATNREAAATLFVSPKTVEFHLGNVYRKLQVRSRTDLVRSYGQRLA